MIYKLYAKNRLFVEEEYEDCIDLRDITVLEQYYEVSNGRKIFHCYTEAEAKFLLELLEKYDNI